MANIVLGSIVTDIRGSVGAETYSRGPAGLVVKARSNPSQPVSAKRDQIQANFLAVTQAWSGRLTAAQRMAWRAYGHRYPRPNKFGARTIVSGYLAFVRCNCSIKLINSVAWIDVPPEAGMLPIPTFTVVAFSENGDFLLTIRLGPYELFEDLCLVASVGKTTNAGVSYYSTPWQILNAHVYDGEAWWPPIGNRFTPPWVGTKDRLWVKAFAFDYITGRLSIPFQASCIIVEI